MYIALTQPPLDGSDREPTAEPIPHLASLQLQAIAGDISRGLGLPSLHTPVCPRRGLQVAAGVPLTARRQTLRPCGAAEPRAGAIESSARLTA